MAKDLMTTKFEPIQPEGLALIMLVVAVVMTVLSSAVVCLRFHVRITLKSFSTEDWLMLAGWIINLGHNASVIVLAYRGIGSHDDVVTVGMMYQIGLWTIIWQFLYVLDGALIKSSIIWTLLRVAKDTRKIYRHILWGLFALCWIVWQISWPVAIFQCKPVSAAWGEPGDCTSGQQVILHVSYFVSAANIFTDIATAMVPAFLLRHMQVPKKAKIATVGILSLGVFAAVATTIRIGYTWAYTAKVDKYYTIAKIVLLTVLECDLGIICGSLPMLRPLFRRLASTYGSGDRYASRPSGHNINLVTIGGTGRRRTHVKLSNPDPDTVNGDRDRDLHSSEDGESTRRIIQVHVTHEVRQETAKGDEGRDGVQFQVAVGSPRDQEHGSELKSARYN
ncbi:hypothetical protein K4K61_005006 [Colletotrichum sp. SAR11_59]|uniref:Integral membrane protein n=1 Tax=Colletotrichum asianum TaxID=702518 RepID=A0A8H3VZK7_9PEZI|nr:integral membrane protein [Colletotrichum asianum]KAI8305825.1 hypothetical protein K4K61_005006 [Colletotrichum sp. SAR11_59]